MLGWCEDDRVIPVLHRLERENNLGFSRNEPQDVTGRRNSIWGVIAHARARLTGIDGAASTRDGSPATWQSDFAAHKALFARFGWQRVDSRWRAVKSTGGVAAVVTDEGSAAPLKITSARVEDQLVRTPWDYVLYTMVLNFRQEKPEARHLGDLVVFVDGIRSDVRPDSSIRAAYTRAVDADAGAILVQVRSGLLIGHGPLVFTARLVVCEPGTQQSDASGKIITLGAPYRCLSAPTRISVKLR